MRTLFTTELRDAWRSLRATPIVTAVAVLSLALGIGANTALFSILNGLILKTLPVREPARLALLAAGDWTNPIWEAIRAAPARFPTAAFAWSAERFDLAERGETEPVDGAWVSGRMFDVLGRPALRGRTITEADDVRGGGRGGPGGGDRLSACGSAATAAPTDVVGRPITVERCPSRSSASCRRASSDRKSGARWTWRFRSARSRWSAARTASSTAARRGG